MIVIGTLVAWKPFGVEPLVVGYVKSIKPNGRLVVDLINRIHDMTADEVVY